MSSSNRITKRMQPGTLRLLLMGIVIAVQLTTVVVVVGGMQAQTAAQFEANARVELDLLAKSVADRAALNLAPAVNLIRTARRLVADGVIDASRDIELLRYFALQTELRSEVEGLYFGRPDGSTVFYERHPEGFRATRVTVTDGRRETLFTHESRTTGTSGWHEPGAQFDPREHEWYRKARASRQLAWTGVYAFPGTGATGISAAQSVRGPDGSFVGVVSVSLRVDHLAALLTHIPEATHGSAIILDEHRHAIAFSDPAQSAEAHAAGDVPSLERIAGRPLQALFGAIDELEDPATELADGFARFQVDGTEHLGLVRAFSPSERREWLMMVETPSAEYSGNLLQLIRDKLRLLVLTVLVPGVFAMYAIWRLTAPVYLMHRDATTDYLTGALARHEFERRLADLTDARRDSDRGSKLIVMALDLDGFKEVNDRHGHGVGDEVLKCVVERLERRVRHTDLVSRTGGDEFVVAMRIDPAIDPVEMARKIRASAVRSPMPSSAGPQSIGMTAGVATQECGESWESLLERADRALIAGKAIGKNRCYVARTPPAAVAVSSGATPERTTVVPPRPIVAEDDESVPARSDHRRERETDDRRGQADARATPVRAVADEVEEIV